MSEEEFVTVDGSTVKSYELLPRSPEFEEVVEAIRVPR